VNNSSSKSTTRIEDDNHLTAVEKPKVNLKVLNGPKEWKPQAMAKALKSCTPSNNKRINLLNFLRLFTMFLLKWLFI